MSTFLPRLGSNTPYPRHIRSMIVAWKAGPIDDEAKCCCMMAVTAAGGSSVGGSNGYRMLSTRGSRPTRRCTRSSCTASATNSVSGTSAHHGLRRACMPVSTPAILASSSRRRSKPGVRPWSVNNAGSMR